MVPRASLTKAQATIAKAMTERELQRNVIDLARSLGWMVAHFRPARVTRQGQDVYRTPVEADGVGFPDLVLARKGLALFVELKAERGSLTEKQTSWYEALCPHSKVWRPNDWFSGRIEEILKGKP